MSNEISLSVNLAVTNGNYTPSPWNQSGSFDQATLDAAAGVLNCTTSFADIPLVSVSTVGFMMAKNCDATNSIDLGIDSSGFVGVMTLKPTEFCVFRWKSGVVPAAKAAAGTAKLMYWLLAA